MENKKKNLAGRLNLVMVGTFITGFLTYGTIYDWNKGEHGSSVSQGCLGAITLYHTIKQRRKANQEYKDISN